MLGVVSFLNQIKRPLFTNQIAANLCSLKIFISLQILHQSCSPGRIDEFGLSNRLISILGAQDIPV